MLQCGKGFDKYLWCKTTTKKSMNKVRKDASVLYPLAAFRNISNVG